MLKHYLSAALRHLRSQLSVTTLNITGLAIGLACFTLIAVFIRHELSYDEQYDTSEKIVRVELSITSPQGTNKIAQSPPAWVPDIVENHADIKSAVRIKPPRQKWMVGTGDRNYSEKLWAFADEGVIDMFDLRLIRGTPDTALEAPMTVIISESMVEKYFDDGQAVGKVLTLDNQYDFEVTGVMLDMPENAHMRFDFLASFNSLYDSSRLYLLDASTFQVPFSYTYLELASDESINTALNAIQSEATAAFAQLGQNTGLSVQAHLRPVSEIHLYSDVSDEIAATGSRSTLLIFGAIGLFILLIASINFMNLATARSTHRAREVGVRKSVGADRIQLLLQFLGESVLTALIAGALALILAWAALPVFAELTGRSLALPSLFDIELLGGMLGVAVIVGLISGSYPAVYLSSFQAASVLKGSVQRGAKGRITFRNVLVTAQFAISIALIVATVTVYQQMVYVSDLNVGYDKEQVVSIELTDPTPASRFQTLRDRISRLPGVQNVSGGTASPAGLTQNGYARPEGATPEEEWLTTFYGVNYDFFDTFGIDLIEGRAFSRDFPTDSTDAIVINRAAASLFGWSPSEAIGKGVNTGGDDYDTVIGVTENFHPSSARESIGPVVIAHNSFHFYAFARIEPARVQETLSEIEQIWYEVVPGYEFDYAFLDDRYANQYESEAVLRELLQYFAILTIIIACLGLFGLASFAAEKRRKEVGIRKALGASVAGIVALLVKDLTRLVLPAFVIAAPIAWYAMGRWLSGFAYATDQHWLTYAVTLLVSIAIAVATVSYQSVRAARVAPVKSLRHE